MLRATIRSATGPASQATSRSERLQWLQRQIIPLLQSLSRRACTHPIHTIVFFALMASTTYIGLLDSNLFDPPTQKATAAGGIDFPALLTGSRTLHIGDNTAWKWQNGDEEKDSVRNSGLALLTLAFPDTISNGMSAPPPGASSIPMLDNSTVVLLPSSKNILSPISQETTLAFSLPYSMAPEFVSSVQELPVFQSSAQSRKSGTEHVDEKEEKRWCMSAVRGEASGLQRTFKRRVSDAWTAFVDLLKNAEELDIVIMVLGYLSMHLTFVSLFMSLRRLGSKFWLGASVLFSSSFAFLFGLLTTIKFGVPLNMVLLSEGLPFLVVTIGFEKPIILTRAVLSAAFSITHPSDQRSGAGRRNDPPPTIKSAIQIAVRETGFEIVRDYSVEILILIAGAASGVQGGLCQFCFLAAWILFYDCILLFTFYTAILTIKLEINRIKRHVALRRALEEDGVSRRVAEEVASSDEWPRRSQTNVEETGDTGSPQRTVFGLKARDSSISKFKVLMVTGFIAINVINFVTIPFRSGIRSTGSALSSAVTQPPMDPFKVAGSALERISISAQRRKMPTTVTVLTPIKYELEYPSVHYSGNGGDTGSIFDIDFPDRFLEGMGGRVVEGVLKSFEDPLLSKWVIIALALSLALNGYLFNAARWSIKDPAQIANDPTGDTTSSNEETNGTAIRPREARSREDVNVPSSSTSELAHEGDTTSSHEAEKRTRKRSQSECDAIVKDRRAAELTDEELIDCSLRGKIPGYALEKTLGDMTRAVRIRRAVISRTPATESLSSVLEKSSLPYKHYEYELVHGACCENVIGYTPLPCGVAGPLMIDGHNYFLPMATTEGVLVASTSRGCKAINAGGGAITVLTGDGMTRGPCVGFSTLSRAGEAKLWVDSEQGQTTIKNAFNSTSRFARLQTLKSSLAGTYLYIRFKTTTGDAMGMNMISKGVETALNVMATEAGFDDMQIISLSGNFCTDKKPAAINWIDGRGKSVVAEAVIPGDVVRNVLKSDVNALVELNIAKNLIGSAMAGSVGGFNAHAANIVAAMFLATGQDPAQTVESSNCITTMKNLNGNLQIAVSMPCIEVGTIGGGTFLPPQAAMLDLLGVRGAHDSSPGSNARQLAKIIAAAVLAGELSLNSALAAGHLVKAHMAHNRSQVPTRAGTPAPSTPTTTAVASMTSLSNNLSVSR